LAQGKPYLISKEIVREAFRRVKKNGGAAGVDAESVEMFEQKLEDNLHWIWNRMSSGSYFPPPVRLCEIPKDDGRKRVLGIPTVSDRVAQMAAKLYLEPAIEPMFHADSYGYRPGKSAVQAVGVARQRCWSFDWVIDLDIKGFFDNIDHPLMMRAVRKHAKEKWLCLYIQRWLKAPAQNAEGEITARTQGTPQGGVISPLLANLFLHYAFDRWMQQQFPTVPFERYADDMIVHCRTQKQAQYVLVEIRRRLQQCRLALNPEKTKVVYCKDVTRQEEHNHTSFDFLGYTFRARSCRKPKGQMFVGFTPAVSQKARKAMSGTIRGWRLKSQVPLTVKELSTLINPIVRGWMNYYGAYCRSALWPVLRHVELTLARWANRKFKKLHRRLVSATRWLRAMRHREPRLFAHWAWMNQAG
jgi:RNA-directed DNA polymerase